MLEVSVGVEEMVMLFVVMGAYVDVVRHQGKAEKVVSEVGGRGSIVVRGAWGGGLVGRFIRWYCYFSGGLSSSSFFPSLFPTTLSLKPNVRNSSLLFLSPINHTPLLATNHIRKNVELLIWFFPIVLLFVRLFAVSFFNGFFKW